MQNEGIWPKHKHPGENKEGWGKCKCEKSPRCRKKDNAGRRTPDETAKVWLSVDKPDLRCKRFVDKVCPL